MFTAKALFIRGAVVVDDLHFSDNFVYGKALVRAYELENKYAVYPRVVIDNSALELVNDEKLPIAQDKDGLYFYDYIQICIIENKEEWLKKIRTFKFNVLLNIRGNLTNASVLNKMEWAVNYYNDNCIKHNIKYLITYEELKEAIYVPKPIESLLEDDTNVCVTGVIHEVSTDKNILKKCPNCRSNVETTIEENVCDNCGHTFDEPNYTLMIPTRIEDETGSIHATFFDKLAEELIGMEKEEVIKITTSSFSGAVTSESS